jgi:hypothetical protein
VGGGVVCVFDYSYFFIWYNAALEQLQRPCGSTLCHSHYMDGTNVRPERMAGPPLHQRRDLLGYFARVL